MTTIKYPLVYYQIQENAMLGILLGTEYQLIEKDLPTLKTKLLSHLQKEFKKTGMYDVFEIKTPKLKVVDIKIRPTYQGERGRFPMSQQVTIPIVAVYGETEVNYHECYLPQFQQMFFFYDPKQFKSLLTHFATDLLNQLSPSELYRFHFYDAPSLDNVSFRFNENREQKKSRQYWRVELEYLDKLATKLPRGKNKRRGAALPEAAWELDEIVADIVDKIAHGKANVLVVGDHGVGKTAALGLAIRKLVGPGNGPKKQSFWEMSAQRFVAKAKYLGEWQEICELVVEDLQKVGGVLLISDMIRLLQIGGNGPEDSVAAFLMNFLQSNQLSLIGEATESELESMRRLLPGFAESFQIIKINELSEEKIQSVLAQFAAYSEKNLKIKIHDDALMLAYRLLLRYFPYEKFPGKGVKFLSKAINDGQLRRVGEINRRDVMNQFIEQTGMPELFLRDDLILDNQALTQFFHERIIGQPVAVEKMAGIVKIFKAGLNNPYKPIQTLLFAGPTGVGKTASAKALADYFFGKGQKKAPLVRIEMSEFQHPSQLSKFIGVGKEVGVLVKEIRERPFSVLLLDEVEKAHPAIFDALMTVLDEGMMVDGFGRITNFRNTIIIMTTNLGASNRKSIGFGEADGAAAYYGAIKQFFRPEFVNRIDGVVFFNSLETTAIRKICLKELAALEKREGLQKRRLKLTFTSQLIERIAKLGFDIRYGARPLQRTIEVEVIEPLGKWLLTNRSIKKKTLELGFEDELLVKVVDG